MDETKEKILIRIFDLLTVAGMSFVRQFEIANIKSKKSTFPNLVLGLQSRDRLG